MGIGSACATFTKSTNIKVVWRAKFAAIAGSNQCCRASNWSRPVRPEVNTESNVNPSRYQE